MVRNRVRDRGGVRDRVRFRNRNRRSEAINFGAIQIADLNLTLCDWKSATTHHVCTLCVRDIATKF